MTAILMLTTPSSLTRPMSEASISIFYSVISNNYYLNDQTSRLLSPLRQSTRSGLRRISRTKTATRRRSLRYRAAPTPSKYSTARSRWSPGVNSSTSTHWTGYFPPLKSSWNMAMVTFYAFSRGRRTFVTPWRPSPGNGGAMLMWSRFSVDYPTRNSIAFLAPTPTDALCYPPTLPKLR